MTKWSQLWGITEEAKEAWQGQLPHSPPHLWGYRSIAKPVKSPYMAHKFKQSDTRECIRMLLFSCVQLFATPWAIARQASLSFTTSQSLLKLMSIELVMPSNHLILCRPLLLLPSVFPSFRVFSNESALCIRWLKYWSFSFSSSSSNDGQV